MPAPYISTITTRIPHLDSLRPNDHLRMQQTHSEASVQSNVPDNVY